MSSSKGKASKFRHIGGTPLQPSLCYGDIRIGNVSPESNVIKVNSTFFAVPWQIAGGVAIVPLEKTGAVGDVGETPLILNQSEEGEHNINELNFSPFDDHLLATAGQDGKARFWKIPFGGLRENITEALSTLDASSKRLLTVEFHPLSKNVVLTAGADYEIKLWDLSVNSPNITIPAVHKGLITNVSWNAVQGDLFVTSCKDKALRLFDPRSPKPLAGEVPNDHVGAKSGKAIWLGKIQKVLSIGFTRSNEREIHLFDPRNISKKLSTSHLDQSSSTPLVFYDDDNSLLYVSGKGDGTIKPYEVTEEDLLPLAEYKSKDPATGLAIMHRSQCNLMKCEVHRLLKLTPSGQAIPIRFEVPRQNNDWFQEDLFPDAWDGQATTSAQEWFAGANNPRRRIPVKPS